VHTIAEQLEHIKSDELTNRLERYLNYPRFDPHGEPIPDTNGDVLKSCFIPLSFIEPETPCRITGVREDSTAFLHLFKHTGLTIGDAVKVLSIELYDNSRFIYINDTAKAHVSFELSQKILVTTQDNCCAFGSSTKMCTTPQLTKNNSLG
jgi:DtxR family transcriptional regulator, Mn-dependent transcriptional regulator